MLVIRHPGAASNPDDDTRVQDLVFDVYLPPREVSAWHDAIHSAVNKIAGIFGCEIILPHLELFSSRSRKSDKPPVPLRDLRATLPRQSNKLVPVHKSSAHFRVHNDDDTDSSDLSFFASDEVSRVVDNASYKELLTSINSPAPIKLSQSSQYSDIKPPPIAPVNMDSVADQKVEEIYKVSLAKTAGKTRMEVSHVFDLPSCECSLSFQKLFLLARILWVLVDILVYGFVLYIVW